MATKICVIYNSVVRSFVGFNAIRQNLALELNRGDTKGTVTVKKRYSGFQLHSVGLELKQFNFRSTKLFSGVTILNYSSGIANLKN